MVERTSCRHILCRWKNNFIIVFFMIPLIYIITVEIQQNLKFIGAYPTLNAKERSTVTIPESEVSIQNQSDGNNFTYHGINLMDLPPYRFDPKYKNPCWRKNNTLHCLPYFFLIGVMKSGTSELWKYIARHPDFARPQFRKESQWFAKRRFMPGKESFDAYISMFEPAAVKIDTANRKDQATFITGEGSPSNLYKNSHWRYLPGNENKDEPKYVILDYVHHFLPQAKIIIIFRDPVDRLYSEYYHRYGRRRKNKPSPEKFHTLVVEGLKLYKECLESRTIRACLYDERIYERLNIDMQLGFYDVYWEELTRFFPREQILPLQNKDLHDIDSIFKKVYKFLDLHPLDEQYKQKMTKKHANARRRVDASKGEMLNKTRKLLVDFYRPHNKKMFRIMGDAAFLYNQPS